jgi:hypothetical protein
MENNDFKDSMKILVDLRQRFKIKNNFDSSLNKYLIINLNENNEKQNIINENSILTISTFRSDLYELLQQLLIFFNEEESPEEKYIMLLIHLIFGINPTNYEQSKEKNKTKRFENIKINQEKLDNLYNNQNEYINELIIIIIQTISNMQNYTYNNIPNENNNSSDEDFDYIFECEIKNFFLKHFSLFSQSVHKLIKTIYSQLEIGITETREYSMFMKILLQNKINFRPLILSKIIRTLNQFNNEELLLFSLTEDEIDLSNEYDILKLNQRLKGLDYINNQKFYNNSIVTYEDIKYVNKNYLASNYKISEKYFNSIYNIPNYKELIEKSEKQKLEKMSNKEIIKSEIEKIKNSISQTTNQYQKDITSIKEQLTLTQNKFNSNIKKLI